MHGEYKVPAGKLVVVDVEVVSGHLASVRLSGDFFLDPDDALEAMNDALVGAPVDASMSTLTTRVAAALPQGVTMLGFDAQAVAIAVRRALGRATSWSDHVFEIIHEEPQSPQMHLALDQVLTESVSAGTRGPTLRIWEWDRPTVVIGSFQSLSNEVDMANAQDLGVSVVRRISGGGAMFIEPGNTITYSLSVPGSLVDGLSFERSYAFLDDWVLGALADIGVQATYQPLNDIASPVGKIAGAAQKRLADGTVLHHVTMAYDIDADMMMRVLRIGREKVSDKGIASANKRVDPVRSQTGLPRAEVIGAMLAHFRSRYASRDTQVTASERVQAQRLIDEKFSDPAWTSRVP